MSKHTPGPWSIDGPTRMGGARIVAPYKPQCTYMVAEVLPDCPDDAARDANARLIAAAPDLLAACKAAVATGMVPQLDSLPTNTKTAVGDAAKMIYDAIAKAQWGAQ
jgi:hypothetical protein